MNRRPRLHEKILLILNILAGVALILSYLAGLISPDKSWFFAFFGLAYPVFLVINFAFILLWLVLFRVYFTFSAILILMGWNTLMAFIPLHFSTTVHPNAESIKIISCNIHHFYGSGHSSARSIPEVRNQFTDFVIPRSADILCLQEYFAIGENFHETLRNFSESVNFNNYYFDNYRTFANRKKIVAIATFTRYPIIDSGSFKLNDQTLFGIYTDLMVNNDTIRVYNLHLESTRFGDDDYSFISNLTDPEKEASGIKEGSKRMMWKLRRAFIIRAGQVKMLREHIADCPYPLIVAGDLNDPPTSFTYHQLTRSLRDSYRDAGRNYFENTYTGKLPAFRIDYILHSGHFSTLSYQKYKVDLSDHYPIESTLVFER